MVTRRRAAHRTGYADLMTDPIAFSGSPLDRSAIERRDPAWVERLLAAPATRFLPLFKLDPLVKQAEGPALAWARWELFEDLDPKPEPMLLGTDGDVAHFAVDVSGLDEPLASLGLEGVADFEDLRKIAGELTTGEVAIFAHARSLLDWHARHRHCPACSGDTAVMLGGAHRRCIECSVEHFPRTDPVAIAVVVKGDRCLLGRGSGWPDTMYSALAGFVETGETIEEAVRREIREESGVAVGDVRYVKSQPWPFPSSLMIGCIAIAESEEITVDRVELVDARWFSRSEVRDALDGKPGPLFVPPPFAIANHLMRAWVDGFSD
jgi:NAD+ diphosphatase